MNFSRQEHQIDVLYVSFNSWDSKVSSYTPFHFSFTVPLKGLLAWFQVTLCDSTQRILASQRVVWSSMKNISMFVISKLIIFNCGFSTNVKKEPIYTFCCSSSSNLGNWVFASVLPLHFSEMIKFPSKSPKFPPSYF